jgi:hypothetical protein
MAAIFSPHREPHALEVHIDDSVERVIVDLGHASAALAAPGVVHGAVETTPPVDAFLYSCTELLRDRGVRPGREHLPPRPALQPRLVRVRELSRSDHELRTFAGEQVRCMFADASRGAGDEDGLPG